MAKHRHKLSINLYNILVTILIFISFGTVAAYFNGLINLNTGGYLILFQLIQLFFGIDYVVRLVKAKSKKDFLIENTFDLLSLIPFHPVFVFFRIYRLIQIIRFYHLFWRLGWSGTITKSLHKFLYDTGFIYLFSISLGILLLSSLIYSGFEHQSLAHSLWWAITTATTVGYGDLTPKTDGGKVVAAFLMIGGVGFIGLLTSTITDFFTEKDPNKETNQQIDDLSKQIKHLTKQVEQLNKQIKNGNH